MERHLSLWGRNITIKWLDMAKGGSLRPRVAYGLVWLECKGARGRVTQDKSRNGDLRHC